MLTNLMRRCPRCSKLFVDENLIRNASGVDYDALGILQLFLDCRESAVECIYCRLRCFRLCISNDDSHAILEKTKERSRSVGVCAVQKYKLLMVLKIYV